MNITETLMRAGTFTGELKPTTPDNVRSELRAAVGWTGDASTFGAADGHIIVTKTPIWPESIITPSYALYTGRLTRIEGDRFSGVGLESWLGANGAPAQIKEAAVATNQDAEAWVDQYVLTGNGNGITKGTVTSDATTYSGDWQWVRVVEHMDKMCSALGFEWRVNADGSLDVDTAANLFATGTVMVTRQPEGVSGAIRGLNGSVVAWTVDATNLTSKTVVAYGTGTVATQTSAGTVAYRLDGVAALLKRLIDDPSADATTAAGIATATQNLFESPRFSFDVHVRSGRVRDHIEPGDTIYVYDPPDVYDTNAGVVMFRGQPTFPLSVRAQQVRWPVTEGYGVYLYRNSGTAAVTDLTPYMVWPDDGAWLTVGTSQGRGDVAEASGMSRFDREAFRTLQ